VESASRNTTSLVEREKKRNEKEGDERRVTETKETVRKASCSIYLDFRECEEEIKLPPNARGIMPV
jgi:hypothetical protein